MHLKALAGIVAAATAAGGVAIAGTTTAPTPSMPVVLASSVSNAASPTQPTKPGKAASPTCDADAHWPAYVQGKPDGFDSGDDGVYLWHNAGGGWSIRVTHPELPGKANRVVFTGVIGSRGTIGHVVRIRDEKDDVVKVGPRGHALIFRFVDYGGVDGVDFTTTCTPGLRMGFRADHTVIAPEFVHLGDKKAHPASDPFVIRRRDADTSTAPVAPKPSSGTGGRSAPSA
jgi:hypothetical protein